MKVLITCGPTWVAIDPVRVISNQSSGELGHLLAEEFKKAGAEVTLIEGPVRHQLMDKSMKVIKYTFFDELAKVLKKECAKGCDVVVHAAAVSDFKPRKMLKTKITSAKTLNLRLVPTQKLINNIKRWAPKTFLVGFKLDDAVDSRTAALISKKLFTQADCDLVVANSLKQGYNAFIMASDGKILAKTNDKHQLAQNLVKSVL